MIRYDNGNFGKQFSENLRAKKNPENSGKNTVISVSEVYQKRKLYNRKNACFKLTQKYYENSCDKISNKIIKLRKTRISTLYVNMYETIQKSSSAKKLPN